MYSYVCILFCLTEEQLEFPLLKILNTKLNLNFIVFYFIVSISTHDDSGKVKHELRVQIHELRVQIHKLRVQIHKLED